MAENPRLDPKAKPKPKFTDKAQSERFIEAAQAHGAESAESLSDQLAKIVAPMPPQGKDSGPKRERH